MLDTRDLVPINYETDENTQDGRKIVLRKYKNISTRMTQYFFYYYKSS